ncbi:MAG: hypothetical protein ACXW2P_10095, partial [Thermoanaerobaculia bacterium]
IRADSGFFNEQYLRLFEERNIPYIIPIRMHPPITRFVASIPAEQWQPVQRPLDLRLDDN